MTTIRIEVPVDMRPELGEYQDKIRYAGCAFCGTKLGNETIQYYAHQGGWLLKGEGTPVWLYVRCPGCKYDWSLWKLGVPR